MAQLFFGGPVLFLNYLNL